MTTKQTKARLASEEVSRELNHLAQEIRRVDEDIEDSYLSRELALYRKLLANRATVLSMVQSLHRCRLHAEKITVNGLMFRFKTLSAQADYLQWVVSTPYSILSNKHRRLVADVVVGYDEDEKRYEMRLQNRLNDRRRLATERKRASFDRRLTLKPSAKLLTDQRVLAEIEDISHANGSPQYAGVADLPY